MSPLDRVVAERRTLVSRLIGRTVLDPPVWIETGEIYWIDLAEAASASKAWMVRYGYRHEIE